VRIDEEFRSLMLPLKKHERDQLEENIKEHGCRDPLVVWNDTLIDGHNRYEICTRNGIDYNTVTMEFNDREAVKDWIDKNQLGRRNITPDWTRYVIGRLYERTKKANDGSRGNQWTRATDQIDTSQTADRIAKDHGVAPATVKRAAKFAREVDASPELKQALVDRTPITKAKKQVRKRRVMEKIQEQEKLPESDATGKYRVVYADPPWKYTSGEQHSNEEQETVLGTHYPNMSTPEICELPIRDLCEGDAVCFLWTTSPMLPEGLQVLRSWGFTYKASMIWDKVKHNVGHYVSVRHEILLIGTRGSCTPDVRKLHDSVHTEERTEHSKKPEHFRNVIDEIYPIGKRVELFARRPVDGWDVWGNQI